MPDIKRLFETMHCELGDSELWEVLTPEGERIASFDNQDDADDFEMALNMVCTDFADRPGAVINIVNSR